MKKTARPKSTVKRAPNAKKAAAARKSRKPAVKRGAPAVSKRPAPIGAEHVHEILDSRLLVPQKVAALAFGISVEALKKWKISARQKRGRETLYYLPDLISLRMKRVDAGEADYIKQKTRLAQLQADKVDLDIQTLKGELIPAHLILETWEPIAGNVRNKVLGIPAKLKTAIPKLTATDLKKVKNIARGVLEDLAQGGIPRRARKSHSKGL